MSRRPLALPGCLAVLLASAVPGMACGLSNFCPPAPGGAPAAQPIVIPPIVMQQIETASTPIALPGAPPPAQVETPAVAPAAPYGGEGGLTSVADLDRGIASWAVIAPDQDFTKQPPLGITFVGPTEPAARARPLPPRTEVQVGLNLTMEVPVLLTQKGVPGVDQPSLGSGNRALWTAPPSRD
jgi:hypothetical protein